MWKEWEMKNWQRDCQKVDGKRNEEDREHNGRKTENTVGGRQRTQWEDCGKKKSGKCLEENVEQQQKIKGEC